MQTKHLVNPDASEQAVFVFSERYDAMEGPWHSHRRAQLIHASEGMLTVRTPTALWVVPPQRAVWICPGEVHKVTFGPGTWLHTLYAEPACAPVPKQCCVVAVDKLLNELLMAASSFAESYPAKGPEQRLMAVILDRLPHLKIVPAHLPRPADPRLLRLAEGLEQNPADARGLDALAAAIGLTERTAARLFVKETGLTFGQWRQQLRLLVAMGHLSQETGVAQAASAVGYADVSAFIALFKRAMGETPGRYFRPVQARLSSMTG